MKHLFYYIPQAPFKKWLNANKVQNIPVATSFFNYLFFRKNSTGTIILNFLVLIVVIIFFFFCEITQPLGIITKLLLNSNSETCLKVTTLKVDPR